MSEPTPGVTVDVEEGLSTDETQPASATGGSNDTTSSTRLRRASFVDYVPPPPQALPPPAKWKLWLLVLFCVFFADWFAYEAGFLPWLENTFKLSRNGALFLLLGSVVCVIIYAGFDLLIFFVRVKIGGKWYGIGSWLKQPRIQWVHEYNNVVVEFIRSIVVIFEDGFAIFNVPEPKESVKPKQFEGQEGRDVVLKIENRIRPEKVDEYLRWRDGVIQLGCHARPGLKKVEEEVIQDPKGDLYVTYFTFESIDYLNEYMASPVRARLLRSLEPLLATPSLVQLQKDRQLPDVFSDLCTKQSQPVPARPPKKWRVWFITSLSKCMNSSTIRPYQFNEGRVTNLSLYICLGLWFVVLITNATVFGHYFDAWGLDGAHVRAKGFVRVLFNTWINTYVQ
jgi:antibiotic biosynthesis monooxygenase (ABM) superfamily enzyme